ncbi:MAG: prefoldin subunit alpha [Candidatus Marsarchaeota archaeon]|nr:prefoldin subunit alpha [Candidatus Marsarchaeota archaeon]MCL5413187.1 prefoldin subunit alpha [Candidatus Marsarchaeota archaeon]
MPNAPSNQPQSADELLMQLRYLQNLYAQQYENLENSIATYTMTNTSLLRNIELLEKSKSVEGSRIMISGEGGAYVPAKIEKIDRIMTYVGGGYMIEKSVAEAIEFLKSNSKTAEELLNRMLSDKKRLESELVDIEYKIGAMQYQASQGSERR